MTERERANEVVQYLRKQVPGFENIWNTLWPSQRAELRDGIADMRSSITPAREMTAATEALAFAHGAIVDAMGEDGLDVDAGAAVLKMIRQALETCGVRPPDVPEADKPLVDAAPFWSLSSLPPVRAEGETENVKRDAPLDCRIVDGRLVIDIGIETLAFATKESPTLYQRYGYDEEKGEERQDFVKINDPDVWAKEVLRQIVAEAEDGSSLMTKLFDDAVERAIDDGAEGIDIPSIGLVDDDDE